MNSVLSPIRPTAPGALLREDVLPELGLTQGEIAARLGLSRRTLNEVLNERRPVSADFAHRVGRLLGNGAGLWLRMQMNCDLWDAHQLDVSHHVSIAPLD